MRFESIKVSCYEGYKSSESPRSFVWRGQTFHIRKVVDRWYEGGVCPGSDILDYFSVELEDGSTCIIRYNRLFDGWAIVVPHDKKPFDQ